MYMCVDGMVWEKEAVLWFDCKMHFVGSYVWIHSSQLVALFWEIVEPFGMRRSSSKWIHGGQASWLVVSPPFLSLFLLHNHPRCEQGALHSYQNTFPSMMSYTCTPWAEISIGLLVSSCWLFGHKNEKKNLKLHLQDGAMHMTSRRRGLLPGGPCMQ